MGYFIIVGLNFGAVSFVVGLMGGLFYLCYIPFKNMLLKHGRLSPIRSSQINMLYIFGLFTFSVFQTYTLFFPSDSFFKDEFYYNTGLKIPASANIMIKSSDIPDFHGDYEASAMIRLGKEDFINIKMKLSKDSVFQIDTTSQPIGRTQSYFTASKGIDENQIQEIFANLKEEWFRVAFLKDGQTIIFERSST